MTIEILNFKPYEKGSLKGFLDYYDSETGYEIFGCTVHSKDNKQWLNLPSKEYKDKNTGETKYSYSLRIRDKDGHFKNTNLVFKALCDMKKAKPVQAEQAMFEAAKEEDNGLPF